MYSTLAQILTISFVHGHDTLDPTFDPFCPYDSAMSQRIATFSEAIYQVSNADSIIGGLSRELFSNQLSSIFSSDEAAVAFPDSIYDSQSWFTYPALVAGLLDLSNHNAWYTVDGIINGTDPNHPIQEYGAPNPNPFYDYLINLDYGVKIVPGESYFWCDDDHAWGFTQATVFIKEKADSDKICQTKRYIGTAEIYTTFELEGEHDHGHEGEEHEEEAHEEEEHEDEHEDEHEHEGESDGGWVMSEFGVFWEIYSEEKEQRGRRDCGSSSSSSRYSSIDALNGDYGAFFGLGLNAMVTVMLMMVVLLIYHRFCVKNTRNYEQIKAIDESQEETKDLI